MHFDSYLVIECAGIAAACAFAALSLAAIRRQSTGSWPNELTPRFRFSSILIWYVILKAITQGWLPSSVPVAIVFSAMDASLFLAMAVVAGRTLTAYSQSEWNWCVALRQASMVVFAFLLGFYVFLDVRSYLSMSWIWMVALLGTSFLLPVLTRAACSEYCQAHVEPPKSTAEPKPEIWRP
jgi:hypothetical protein